MLKKIAFLLAADAEPEMLVGCSGCCSYIIPGTIY